MGWLAAQGTIMAIGLFIGLVCSVIGLFFGHIIPDLYNSQFEQTS